MKPSTFATIAVSVLLLQGADAATLIHRYSFSGDTVDSVENNTGILEGGATVDATALVLTGTGTGPTANRMTFTTPVDIGFNFGATGVTIEAWYTDNNTGTWGKLFHFGNNVAGEELAYTHMRGNGQMSGIDRGGAQLFNEQIAPNEEHHLVITVSADGNLNTWVDGDQKLTNIDTNDLANVNTTFEAIGATSWNDPGMNGTVNEFRIWEGELTPIEVASSFDTGPDEIFVVDDADGDGLPNIWEEMFGLDANDNGENPNNNGEVGDPDQGAMGDPDGDLLTNLREFEETDTNPIVGDTDGDLLLDGEEVDVFGTNPLVADTDGDSLTDGFEVLTFMSSPLLRDSDNDLYPDDIEFQRMTDPNDPNDPPALAMPELVHRYSFNAGSELVDSVGGNTGVLFNTATVDDGQLQLDGMGTGPAATSMRFTEPVRVGDNFGATGVTIEAWFTDLGTPVWGKLFHFGTNAIGQEIAWTNMRGGGDLAPGLDRDGARPIASIPFGSDSRLSTNEEHHLVVSVASDGTTNLFIDGTQEIFDEATNGPSNIVSSTESIGSTAWNDPGHLGSVNEFRIWRGALDANAIADNFLAGPDNLSGFVFEITDVMYDAATGEITIVWSSIPGRNYAIDATSDLTTAPTTGWLEIDDVQAMSSSTSYSDSPPAGATMRYYRVRDIDGP